MTTLDGLAAIIGRDRVSGLLDLFASGLAGQMDVMAETNEDGVARQAHMLTATAGQLGFLHLSRLAAEVARGGAPVRLLRDLRAVAERAAAAARASPYARAG